MGIFTEYFLQNFKSRFCKRGRTVRQRSLVVQRVLPPFDTKNSPDATPPQDTNMNIEVSLTAAEPQPDSTNVANIVMTNEEEDFMAGTLEEESPTALKASTSIITSATQILKEGEHQWLNSEVIRYYL